MVERITSVPTYRPETLYSQEKNLPKAYTNDELSLDQFSNSQSSPSTPNYLDPNQKWYKDASSLLQGVRKIGKDLLQQGQNIIDDPKYILQQPLHTLGILASLYFYKTAIAVFGLATLFGYVDNAAKTQQQNPPSIKNLHNNR